MQNVQLRWRRLGCLPEQAGLVGLIAGVGVGKIPAQDQHICSREHLQPQHVFNKLTQLLSKHTGLPHRLCRGTDWEFTHIMPSRCVKIVGKD